MKQLDKSPGRRRLATMAAWLLALGGVAVTGSPAAQAAPPLPDGQTSFTAAASCWEIKQHHPASTDGVYWLVTPTLVAPEQFYCDMTTDGGGWVLIGRGRNGWSPQYEGAGTAADVRDVITGQAAFKPAQLPSRTIDGLLDGQRVDALADGVRVRRATDTGGAAWQEARFTFARRDRWVWALGAEHPVSTWRFDAVSGSGGQTANLGTGSGLTRLDTREKEAQGWTRGMAYGSEIAGDSAATSYLWSQTTGQGTALPFAQVFLRPQLRLSDLTFAAVPDSGTTEQELSPLANAGALASPWGVTGLANGRDGELTTEVSAFTRIGNTVYVGGNFQYVQRGQNATGADKVEQSYLAAFDAVTGNWIPGFRPVLNGQVKALAALPNGTVVAGGEFTTASGQPSAGVVALDAATGQKASGWNIQVENRLTGGIVQVRALTVNGNWLYLGGAFTHVSGGASSNAVYARAGARVRVSDGLPDGTWNPAFNGTVVAMDTTPAGDKVYASGYFGTAQGLPAFRATQLTSDTASPSQAWTPTWSSNNGNYQQAIGVDGPLVWVGGAEHSLFSWDTSTFAQTSGSIGKQGGDFQTLDFDGDLVYASCHCNDWMYTDAFKWPSVGSSWTQADKVGYVGAWDTSTGDFIPDFDPILNVRRGAGGWATLTDAPGGITWFGGDFTRAVLANGSSSWTGGFVRFAARDTDAPSRPGSLSLASSSPAGSTLTWAASSGQARYEVIQGDRVVATTTATSVTVPAATEATRYFVRAVDSTGNRSASTSVLTLQPAGAAPAAPVVSAEALSPSRIELTWSHDAASDVAAYRVVRDGTLRTVVNAPGATFEDTGLAADTTYTYEVIAVGADGQLSPAGTAAARTLVATAPDPVLVPAGTEWRWRYDATTLPAQWRERTFDDSGWARGSAVLGFGSTSLGTNIDVPAPTSNRPLSAQFRRAFTVTDPNALSAVSLSVRADDGVVVHVNGTEVGRANLPTGVLTQNSYATVGPRSTFAAANLQTFVVPTSLLVAGQNVVTASVHLGWRATPDVSFDLSMKGD